MSFLVNLIPKLPSDSLCPGQVLAFLKNHREEKLWGWLAGMMWKWLQCGPLYFTVVQKWAGHASSGLHYRCIISSVSLAESPRSVKLFADNMIWAAQVLGLTAVSSTQPSDGYSDSLEMFVLQAKVLICGAVQIPAELCRSPGSKGSRLTKVCCTSWKRNFGEMWPCNAAVNTQRLC